MSRFLLALCCVAVITASVGAWLILAAFGEPQSAWLVCDVLSLEAVCR